MGSLTEHVNGPFVFIFVMVSYVLAFLPVSMVILELVVHDQYFYARLCRVRPRLARQSRLVWTGLYVSHIHPSPGLKICLPSQVFQVRSNRSKYVGNK